MGEEGEKYDEDEDESEDEDENENEDAEDEEDEEDKAEKAFGVASHCPIRLRMRNCTLSLNETLPKSTREVGGER